MVVVHPPFRWQRDYATGFVEGIADLERRTGIAFAVENMYPWRATSRREMKVYQPGWDPSEEQYANTTIDLSHAATAKSDPVAMAERLGDRLRHVHMTDGSGSPKDEHLVPGHGNQPCGPFLELLADRGFEGHIVVEINTRKAGDREAREADLLEALAFSRLHFAARTDRDEPGERSAGPGRRPDTRAEILAAARTLFATRGFRQHVDPCDRGARPASTPRWCTTTSAPRTTCSWPRCSCPVDPRRGAGAGASRAASTARASGCCGSSSSVWDDPETRLPLLGLVRSVLDPPRADAAAARASSGVVLGPIGQALGHRRAGARGCPWWPAR